MTQCRFIDLESNEIHGGIIDDEGNVICGCCGGLIEKDEVCQPNEEEKDTDTIKLIEIYDNWINLDEEICGNDLYDDGYKGLGLNDGGDDDEEEEDN